MSLSRLQVITPAADLSLLSTTELRVAAGLDPSDATHDDALVVLGAEAGEWIADVLGIRSGGSHIPTVVSEVLRETFSPGWYGSELVLARRFVSNVSVIENGMALVEDADFAVADDRGVVERIASGLYRIGWQHGPIVVDYTAGFDNGSPSNVPPLIKAMAGEFVKFGYLGESFDPTIQSETVNDIDAISYRTGSAVQGAREALTDTARNRLARYVAMAYSI